MKRASKKNLGTAYGEALADLDKAERKLARAFNAWGRARSRLKSLGRRLDDLQLLESNERGD